MPFNFITHSIIFHLSLYGRECVIKLKEMQLINHLMPYNRLVSSCLFFTICHNDISAIAFFMRERKEMQLTNHLMPYNRLVISGLFSQYLTMTYLQLPPFGHFKFKFTHVKINSIFGVQNQSIHSNINTNGCARLLQLCTNPHSLKSVHAHMIITGHDQDVFLGAKLVSMYAKLDSLENARSVFDKIYNRDAFLWNVIIKAYGQSGLWDKTLASYYQMQEEGIQPDNFTFPLVLKACASLSALEKGKEIHYQINQIGFGDNIIIRTTLIDMYAKCGSLEDARQVFNKMSERDVFSWSAMIAGYAQFGNANEALLLSNQMQLEGVLPDSVVMVSLLQACGDLGARQQGMWVHGCLIRRGFESDVSAGNSLVAMYAKCGNMCDARRVFEAMPEKNVISWTAMIAGYAQNGQGPDALALFDEMKFVGVNPNSVTMVNLLSVCADLGAVHQGKVIHNYVIGHGFESNEYVANGLMDMYAKCGSPKDAQLVFNRMPQKSVVSWNTIISGYAQNGYFNEALALFHQMQLAGMLPDSVTIVSVLSACAHVEDLQQGKWIHDYTMQCGFDSNVFVSNSLIDMYAKCKKIDIARQIFDGMHRRDVVSWNAMITGYVQNAHANEALELFNQMQLTDVKPDSETMVSVLSACGQSGALQQGERIHNYVIKNGFEWDVFVETGLVDMYAKCGNVDIARHLFDQMPKRTVVAYSAMIAGYGMHGYAEDALTLFSQMQQTGMKPNGITFISVLSACSHSGLVDDGWRYFNCMSKDYGIAPMLEHYACVVDLLGRAGCLDEAQDFIKNMPVHPNAAVWGALLAACRIHCNIELAECAAEILFDLEPNNAGYYVLLSNTYAAAGRWDEVAKVRTKMKNMRLRKTAGCSLIEINSRLHSFIAGDNSHPQFKQIYVMLEILSGQMKDAGYVPNTNFVMHDVE